MKRSICGVLMLILAGCAQSGSETATTTESGTVATETATETAATTTDQASATAEETSMTQYENKVAEIHTSAGQVNIRFFPGEAPNHVKNFIDLAQKGFYNGTKFHRVIPGFMVQGGDPNTISGDPGSWGTGGNGGNYLKAEFNSISHKRGIVSMARAQSPDSASSQFFICVADSPFLDKQYSVFGQVTQGMDVVDKIVSAKRGANDRPDSPTSIEKIVIRDAAEGESGPAPK